MSPKPNRSPECYGYHFQALRVPNIPHATRGCHGCMHDDHLITSGSIVLSQNPRFNPTDEVRVSRQSIEACGLTLNHTALKNLVRGKVFAANCAGPPHCEWWCRRSAVSELVDLKK